MTTLYVLATRLPRPFYLVLAACLYLLMFFMGMTEATVQALPGREHWSKVYHLCFYSGMGGMLWFGARSPSIARITALVALGGAFDEFHQYFLPFREARVSDVLIDTVAALAATVFLFYLQRQVHASGRLAK